MIERRLNEHRPQAPAAGSADHIGELAGPADLVGRLHVGPGGPGGRHARSSHGHNAPCLRVALGVLPVALGWVLVGIGAIGFALRRDRTVFAAFALVVSNVAGYGLAMPVLDFRLVASMAFPLVVLVAVGAAEVVSHQDRLERDRSDRVAKDDDARAAVTV